MTDDKITQLIEDCELLPDEKEDWLNVMSSLNDEDKESFVEMLEKQVKEKQILATKQANELALLKASWDIQEPKE